MARQLMVIAVDIANNPSWWKKIRHSKFADPFRRKSVSRIVTKGASFAISFIPIPVVKGLVDKAVKKGLSVVRAYQVKYKKTKHTHDKEHTVKWGWKELDVSSMDRYRWKVKHAVEMLKKSYESAKVNKAVTASLCNDWARAMAKYLYLEKRIAILKGRATAIHALSGATLEWIKEIEEAAWYSKIEMELRTEVNLVDATTDD